MKKTAQIKSSTQKFIEIEDIYENIVFLSSGNAALIIEVTAVNFALLSSGEQNAKIASYVSFLNSLSFPIQIVVSSRQLDISSYLNRLKTEETAQPNPVVKERITLYREFVANLVKVNVVLDKRFYIIVSFSYLEKGVSAAASRVKKGSFKDADFKNSAKAGLHAKAQAIQSQLTSLNLKTKILQQQELTQLFYEIYNSASSQTSQLHGEETNPVVKTSQSSI